MRSTQTTTQSEGVAPFSDLKRIWARAMATSVMPESMMDSLSLTPMAPALKYMVELTKRSGREHGRLGFFELFPIVPNTPFILGPITIGDSGSVNVKTTRPRSAPLASASPLIIHTHPSSGYVSALRQVEHFSTTDITTLMLDPQILASIVLTGNRVLLMHKLRSTPRYSKDQLEKYQTELINEATGMARQPGDAARIYSKLARLHYSLSFLIGDLGPNIIMRKVSL